jgi:uncharacterized membrane protein
MYIECLFQHFQTALLYDFAYIKFSIKCMMLIISLFPAFFVIINRVAALFGVQIRTKRQACLKNSKKT